ncbi:branched-chain amino acid ABC transporter permease [Bifidobacterium longum]|uniref:Branched-chain amino acid ABC transporter permease n=1 Tax=Bifidobacterium longum TaxID=216816 RepID=A0A6A2SPG4_BIFLN|nr:branched-chain amino acid ABC transporter permease [Bifidobacterium longum]KAB7019155.1 branched-chain amino acid ABC transporter permease [Bifidobacterium longum]KAB7019557.1 branched-chain amino acid ABC transporter permease [Bifidobacterium longum]KAB7025175.1 branched-chain amino acid ABC transporter permease [Bifidobacterium longum]KAB7025593.1 branched-chain amino acid ABC transporter permease [Bifidobacterium longum]
MCSWFHLSTCSRPPQGLSHRRRCDILHTVTSRTGSRRHPHPVYRHHACITAYGIIGEHRPADQLYKENIIHMADTANTNTNAWLPALKAAFPLTIPICLGFLFLGASYGILMGTKGFSFVWPMCMSAFIFAGSMEFVTVNLLLSAFNPLAGFLLALMVNARHLFYGLSMLGKFKGLGWKRPYLFFGMCDETFAINSTAKIPAGIDRGWFYFWVTLCNQLYWVTGATLGGLIGAHLPFNTDGLDFVLTALFLVIFLDQWLDGKHRERLSAVIGVLTSLACLLIFGANDFMIPSMIAMLILFVALRPHLDVLRPAADAPEATADHAMSHAADQQKEGQTR